MSLLVQISIFHQIPQDFYDFSKEYEFISWNTRQVLFKLKFVLLQLRLWFQSYLKSLPGTSVDKRWFCQFSLNFPLSGLFIYKKNKEGF